MHGVVLLCILTLVHAPSLLTIFAPHLESLIGYQLQDARDRGKKADK
jgi:hypothetical protein